MLHWLYFSDSELLKCFTCCTLPKSRTTDSKADDPQMLHWLYSRESQSLWRFTGYTIAMHRSLAIDGGSNAVKTNGCWWCWSADSCRGSNAVKTNWCWWLWVHRFLRSVNLHISLIIQYILTRGFKDVDDSGPRILEVPQMQWKLTDFDDVWCIDFFLP